MYIILITNTKYRPNIIDGNQLSVARRWFGVQDMNNVLLQFTTAEKALDHIVRHLSVNTAVVAHIPDILGDSENGFYIKEEPVR